MGAEWPVEMAKDLPADTWVEMDRPTADLLSLRTRENNLYEWQEFQPAWNVLNSDTGTLVEAILLAQAHRRVPTSLPLFRAPSDNRGYRPIIYKVTCQEAGSVEVQLVLATVPATMDPDASNAFERVHRLFCLGKQFRRDVVEKHGYELSTFDEHTPADKKLAFFKAVLFNVEEVRAESADRGFKSDWTLFDSFDESRRAVLEGLVTKWHVAYEALKRAVAEGGAGDAGSILNPMH